MFKYLIFYRDEEFSFIFNEAFQFFDYSFYSKYLVYVVLVIIIFIIIFFYIE